MKWILAFLLFFNVGLGGYQYWISTEPVVPSSESEGPTFNNLSLSQSQQQRLAAAGQPISTQQPNNQLQCIRITGLVAGDSVPVVESRLRALEVVTEISVSQELIKTDYQVLLGPFDNAETARDSLNSVSAQGIEGYVITSGENANALSLGVFSNQANAERRISELPSLNSQPTVFRKDYFVDSTIINIGPQSASLINDETLTAVLSAFENADFMRYNCN